MWTLPRALGGAPRALVFRPSALWVGEASSAREMLAGRFRFAGRAVEAQEALAMGLANRVVPEGHAVEEAVKLAPDHPLNHFFLAGAYAKDDEVERAQKHYGVVLCAKPGAAWDRVLAGRWSKRARKALQALKKPAPKCP